MKINNCRADSFMNFVCPFKLANLIQPAKSLKSLLVSLAITSNCVVHTWWHKWGSRGQTSNPPHLGLMTHRFGVKYAAEWLDTGFVK